MIPGSGRSPAAGIGYPLQYSWASLVAQLVKNLPAMWAFDPWVGKIPWRRERLSTPVFWPGGLRGVDSPWDCKESDMTGRLSLSPGGYAAAGPGKAVKAHIPEAALLSVWVPRTQESQSTILERPILAGRTTLPGMLLDWPDPRPMLECVPWPSQSWWLEFHHWEYFPNCRCCLQ